MNEPAPVADDASRGTETGWRPHRGDRLLVLAGNARQAAYWCREWRVDPRTEATYAYSLRDVAACRGGVRYAIVGTFWDDPPRDATEILDRLKLLGAEEWRP